MKKIFFILTSFSIIAGCASYELKPGAENVKVSKNDPGEKCKEIGQVEGMHPRIQERRNALKNNAAKISANYVRLDTVPQEYTEVGTAYKCP